MTDVLTKYFKNNPTLSTDIGEFTFDALLGQGGNAHVFRFTRGKHSFAIKLLAHGDENKLKRFRDEFFAAAQIPCHRNVVDSYHFDTTTIESVNYSMIVMKAYDSTLQSLRPVVGKEQSEREALAIALFTDLCNGLNHLHTHGIVHRDIKPQNIFYDAGVPRFVIGDLGIAHFNADLIAKEAKTKPAERMANYLFSAPEQADSKNTITASADIYALGQVIQWYLTGSTVRGLGRPSFADQNSKREVSVLDAFVEKAIRHTPAERFQCVEEIREFFKKKSAPNKDPWLKINAFDDVIRSSFPQIKRTLAVTDQTVIRDFLETFQEKCDSKDFWYLLADEGDGHFLSLKHLQGKVWLLNEDTEMTVSKLLVYRDNGFPYKNFFILLFGPDKRFVYQSAKGTKVKRRPSVGEEDWATLVDGSYYIDPAEVANGYYKENGETVAVTRDRFKDRSRYLVPTGVIVVPMQTASASMTDRTPTGALIRSAVQTKNLSEEGLKVYLDATRAHHSFELTKYN